MARSLAIALAALLALGAALPVMAGKYYKWVDEDGVTQYTQQPPPAGQAARVEAKAATLPGSTPRAPDEADDGGEQDAAGDGEADGTPDTVAEFCRRMREEESMLAGDRPVKTKEPDGTLEPLEGDARAQRLAQVRSQLQQHCGGDEAG